MYFGESWTAIFITNIIFAGSGDRTHLPTSCVSLLYNYYKHL